MVHNSPIDIITKNFSGEYDCETTVDEMCKWFRKRTLNYINYDGSVVTLDSPYTWSWDYDHGVYRANVTNVRNDLRSKKSKHKEEYNNTSKELDDFLSEFKVKEAVDNG